MEAGAISTGSTVSRQAALLAEAERDEREMPQFSRAMVHGRHDALVDISPLLAIVDSALASAPDAPDDAHRIELAVLRAALACHGPGLEHVQVRLNASQLHNAIRRRVGLDTDPNDPSNRRSYFSTINDLLGVVRPVTLSFASLMAEQASARRLMMTGASAEIHGANRTGGPERGPAGALCWSVSPRRQSYRPRFQITNEFMRIKF